ncbi:MAG: dTDP-4-dehydrorhamnose 3,5-epimerase [bacterium]
MRIRRTGFDGLLLFEPEVHADARGFFLETFREENLEAAGISVRFVQDNHSRSVKGTVRALHFQAPPGQVKLVRCARGSVFDVAVDLRRSSRTFGKAFTVELSDENHRQLFLPQGFAHGFCATSDVADVVYRCGPYWDQERERGIAWNSPELGIEWPVKAPVLSERDRRHPTFSEYPGPWFP